MYSIKRHFYKMSNPCQNYPISCVFPIPEYILMVNLWFSCVFFFLIPNNVCFLNVYFN